MTKKLLLNEWEELGGENAAKGTLKKLADKYGVPEGTVRRWKSEYLKKNEANVRNKKRTNSERSNERDIQVKKDILNDIPKEEVMRKNEISNATYYRKSESIRQLRLEKTEEQMLEIAKNIIKIKTKNQLELLKNFREKSTDLKENISKIKSISSKINSAESYDVLL